MKQIQLILSRMKEKSKSLLSTIDKDIIKREKEIIVLKKQLFDTITFKEFIKVMKELGGQMFNFPLKDFIDLHTKFNFENLKVKNINYFPDYAILCDKIYNRNKVQFCSSIIFPRNFQDMSCYILYAYYLFISELQFSTKKTEYDYDLPKIKKQLSSEFDLPYRKFFLSERNPILPSINDAATLNKSLGIIDISSTLQVLEKYEVSIKSPDSSYYISNIDTTYTAILCKDSIFGRRLFFFNSLYTSIPQFEDTSFIIKAQPIKQIYSINNVLLGYMVFFKDEKLYGFIRSDEIGFN